MLPWRQALKAAWLCLQSVVFPFSAHLSSVFQKSCQHKSLRWPSGQAGNRGVNLPRGQWSTGEYAVFLKGQVTRAQCRPTEPRVSPRPGLPNTLIFKKLKRALWCNISQFLKVGNWFRIFHNYALGNATHYWSRLTFTQWSICNPCTVWVKTWGRKKGKCRRNVCETCSLPSMTVQVYLR